MGNSVLALIEAVVCDKPLSQDAMKADLESHFQKLLGYGSPRVFFHLTYAYVEDKAELLRSLEALSRNSQSAWVQFSWAGADPSRKLSATRIRGAVLSRFWRGKGCISCPKSRSATTATSGENRRRHKGPKGVEKAEKYRSQLTTDLHTREQTFQRRNRATTSSVRGRSGTCRKVGVAGLGENSLGVT